jgi:hypothetical protein
MASVGGPAASGLDAPDAGAATGETGTESALPAVPEAARDTAEETQ